jgi:hypothetical protein
MRELRAREIRSWCGSVTRMPHNMRAVVVGHTAGLESCCVHALHTASVTPVHVGVQGVARTLAPQVATTTAWPSPGHITYATVEYIANNVQNARCAKKKTER